MLFNEIIDFHRQLISDKYNLNVAKIIQLNDLMKVSINELLFLGISTSSDS